MKLIIKDNRDVIEEINYVDSPSLMSRVVIPTIGDIICLSKGYPPVAQWYKVIDRFLIYHANHPDVHQTIVLIVDTH